MRLKFLRRTGQGDWFIHVEEKMDLIGEDMGRGQEIVTITRGTRPGGLARIDRVYYQNSYPVTEVVFGLYLIREQHQPPMRVGRLDCVVQRSDTTFQDTLRGQGLRDVSPEEEKVGGNSPRMLSHSTQYCLSGKDPEKSN